MLFREVYYWTRSKCGVVILRESFIFLFTRGQYLGSIGTFSLLQLYYHLDFVNSCASWISIKGVPFVFRHGIDQFMAHCLRPLIEVFKKKILDIYS